MTREELRAHFLELAEAKDGSGLARILMDLVGAVELASEDGLRKSQDLVLEHVIESADRVRQIYSNDEWQPVRQDDDEGGDK